MEDAPPARWPRSLVAVLVAVLIVTAALVAAVLVALLVFHVQDFRSWG
jgi:hypothetical protein